MERSVDLSMETANVVLEELHQNQQQLLFSQEKLFELSRDSIKPILEETCRRISKLMNC